MGGVELLSREGEIAIAKRIEARKRCDDKCINPKSIVGNKIFEWKEQNRKSTNASSRYY